MRHVNHVVSKEVVAEAVRVGAGAVGMEDLTHIRDRIIAGLRVRTRRHRWAFRQLRDFTSYNLAAAGIAAIGTDPRYTSRDCSSDGSRGVRRKHRFQCRHGHQFHSDVNSARNHAALAEIAIAAGAEPLNSGRPRPIRVARRDSRPDDGRCHPPQCSGLADVVQHVSL
ncbi:MAG: transposase [Bradyrhizobiaceae bacterium]|nr:transposase [Bradyrhizobiaceae bacterium]